MTDLHDRLSDDDMIPLDEIRRLNVTKVLEACGGNPTNAAQVLNIDRKTLYRKLLRWGLASRP